MPIRPDRLIGDLRALAQIGKYETGVNRPAFSAEDIASREWLRDKLREAGLTAEIDGVGNVYGRMDSAERAVLIGSHSDTVPKGGWLDGALGVIYGLEIARCIAESGGAKLGVDVISFEDEEGTYLGLLGSRSFCGEDVARGDERGRRSGRQDHCIARSKMPGCAPTRWRASTPSAMSPISKAISSRARAWKAAAPRSASSAPSSASRTCALRFTARPITPAPRPWRCATTPAPPR